VLGAVLVTVPAIAALLWLSGSVSLGAAVTAATVFAIIVLAAGVVLLRVVDASDLPISAAWVLGVTVTAYAVYMLVSAFDLLAATAFVIWAAVLALSKVAWIAQRGPGASERPAGVAALLFCSAATLFWCWGLAQVPHHLAHDGVMTTWVDQFIHGAQISQFGDPRAASRQSIQLADTARPLYHYVSYMLPAALVQPLDLPGLTLATSFWVPVGFLTLCAGAYTLGAALAGPGAGFASLVVLTLLPDAASYGPMNRAFGYYWLVLEVPGGAYATGACLVSFAFLHRWTETRQPRLLIASGSLVVACLLIRLHIFLLAFPAWMLCAALVTPALARRKLAVLATAAVAFALFVFGYYAVFPQATPALGQFLHVIHEVHPSLPLETGYSQLVRNHGPAVALAGGVFLVLPACLGIFLLLYPVSVVLVRRVRPLHAADAVPAVFLACYVLLMMTAPVAPNGDATEFPHRPFVLLYAVVAVWTAAGFATWLAAIARRRAARAWTVGIALAAAAGAAGVLFTAPDARWDEYHWLEPGVPQAGYYIRAHSQAGDLLAVQGLDLRPVASDGAIQLVALTGVPAYLSRPFIHATRSRKERQIAERRYAELEQVANEPSLAAALGRLRELGIRWYIVPGTAGPGWDPGRGHAAFVAGEIAVYRVDGGRADEQ
jgi:hypothetical protein